MSAPSGGSRHLPSPGQSSLSRAFSHVQCRVAILGGGREIQPRFGRFAPYSSMRLHSWRPCEPAMTAQDSASSASLALDLSGSAPARRMHVCGDLKSVDPVHRLPYPALSPKGGEGFLLRLHAGFFDDRSG